MIRMIIIAFETFAIIVMAIHIKTDTTERLLKMPCTDYPDRIVVSTVANTADGTFTCYYSMVRPAKTK